MKKRSQPAASTAPVQPAPAKGELERLCEAAGVDPENVRHRIRPGITAAQAIEIAVNEKLERGEVSAAVDAKAERRISPMSSSFSSAQLAAITTAHSAVNTAISAHDSTPGEPAKLELAKQELQTILRAHLGLFHQVAPAFIKQTIAAGHDALSPWVSDAGTREKIVNEHFGLRDINLAISSVERSVHDPSAAIAGLRSMALVFSAVLSAPQNQS